MGWGGMTNGITPRQRTALENLVERGVLTGEQFTAVLEALQQRRSAAPVRRGGLWEVLGYVGGALVLGGAALLVGLSWEDLTRSARVTLLLAATAVLVVAGTVIAGGPRGVMSLAGGGASAKARVVAVLLALASCTAAMATGSALESFGGAALAATAVGLLVAVAGFLLLPSKLGVFVSGAFSVGVVLAAAEEWFDSSTLVITIGLIALGAVWVTLALLRTRVDEAFGLVFGAVIALIGAQWPMSTEHLWWGYGTTVVIAALCFAGYVWLRIAALLVPGVIGMTIAVPEAVWDWTGGALSAPLTVLVVGLVFLIAAGAGVRLSNMRSGQLERSPRPRNQSED